MRISKQMQLGFIVFIIVLGWLFYINSFRFNSPEKIFYNKVVSQLKKDGDYISIDKITPFDWDKVCLNRSDSMGNFVADGITKDQAEKKIIAKEYVALAFFRDGKLNTVLGYSGKENLSINGKKYYFLTGFEDKACAPKKLAALKAKTIDTKCCGQSSEIIFSSGENE